jgi:RNA ligase (TIGR02306 family)
MSAKITKILSIEPMTGYDSIELATVFNWTVAVTKGLHHVGEFVIYYGIGSILPNEGPTAFLEGQRLKTRKFRDYISQGLVGPLSWLKQPVEPSDDLDVTEIQGVTKFIPPEERSTYEENASRTKWPQFIPKTDEERAQYCLRRLDKTSPITITKKFDGTSTTFAWADRFIICSRNNELLATGQNEKVYYDMAEKYGLKEKMQELARHIAIQGETVGPKINCNRLKMSSIDFYVFNIYDISNACYLGWAEVEDICRRLGLKTVDVIYRGEVTDDHLNIKWLLELADAQTYDSGAHCEGIVIKTDNPYKRFSCKVISNKYILKHGL